MEGQKFSSNLTRTFLFRTAQFVNAQYVSRRILDRDKRNILCVQPCDPSAQVWTAEPAEHFHIVVRDRVRHLVSLLVPHCFEWRTQYWQLGWSWKGCKESPTSNTGTKSAQVSLATPHSVLLTLEQSSCLKTHSCTTLYYALGTMHYAHSSCLKAPSCHPLTCQLYASTTASPHAFLVLSRAPLLSLDCRDRGDANDPDYDFEARHQDEEHKGCSKKCTLPFCETRFEGVWPEFRKCVFGTSYW